MELDDGEINYQWAIVWHATCFRSFQAKRYQVAVNAIPPCPYP